MYQPLLVGLVHGSWIHATATFIQITHAHVALGGAVTWDRACSHGFVGFLGIATHFRLMCLMIPA